MAGRSTGKLVKQYNEVKRTYERCMDNAINGSEDFRKLLDQDESARRLAQDLSAASEKKRLAAHSGGDLYSFAVANGRYQQLKSELAPAGDPKGVSIGDIELQQGALKQEHRSLQTCLSNLDGTRLKLADKIAAYRIFSPWHPDEK